MNQYNMNSYININDNKLNNNVKALRPLYCLWCKKVKRQKANFRRGCCYSCVLLFIDYYLETHPKPKPIWARKWDQCQACGRTDRRHWCLGLCHPCYRKINQKDLIHKTQKKYRGTEKYRAAILKYRSTEKYIQAYKLKYPGSLKFQEATV